MSKTSSLQGYQLCCSKIQKHKERDKFICWFLHNVTIQQYARLSKNSSVHNCQVGFTAFPLFFLCTWYEITRLINERNFRLNSTAPWIYILCYFCSKEHEYKWRAFINFCFKICHQSDNYLHPAKLAVLDMTSKLPARAMKLPQWAAQPKIETRVCRCSLIIKLIAWSNLSSPQLIFAN